MARPGYYVHEICDSKGNYIDLDTNGNVIKKSASANLLPTASAAADMQENQSPVIILVQKNESVNPGGETQLSVFVSCRPSFCRYIYITLYSASYVPSKPEETPKLHLRQIGDST